jgi:hypothetical protein
LLQRHGLTSGDIEKAVKSVARMKKR